MEVHDCSQQRSKHARCLLCRKYPGRPVRVRGPLDCHLDTPTLHRNVNEGGGGNELANRVRSGSVWMWITLKRVCCWVARKVCHRGFGFGRPMTMTRGMWKGIGT